MPQIDTFSGFLGPVFNQVCVLRPITNLCFNGEFDPLSLSRLWGELMGCVHSRELGARASPFEVYPVGSFSGALLVVSALGIDYDRRICSPEGVLNGSCGSYGFFVTCGLGWLFQVCGGSLWAVFKVKSSVRERAPRFPRFILLRSGNLLVVSALGIVYDWHL